jgi:hypothetical protein
MQILAACGCGCCGTSDWPLTAILNWIKGGQAMAQNIKKYNRPMICFWVFGPSERPPTMTFGSSAAIGARGHGHHRLGASILQRFAFETSQSGSTPQQSRRNT